MIPFYLPFLLLYILGGRCVKLGKEGNQSSTYDDGRIVVHRLVDKQIDDTISTQSMIIYDKNLTMDDVLDVYRLRLLIKNGKKHAKSGLRFIQVSATNGRDSVTFSLPDISRDGTVTFDGARLLNPIMVMDTANNRSQLLTISLQSRVPNVFYTLWATHLDRSQYYIKFSDKTRSVGLSDQKVSNVRPNAYRLNTTKSDTIQIAIRSSSQLCGVFVISNDERSIYTSSGELSSDGFVVRTISFTNRLDLMLRREQVKEVLFMYVLVQPDDTLCNPFSSTRELNKVKEYNISWSAEPDMSYATPVISFLSVFLLPPVLLVIYAVFSVFTQNGQRGELHLDTESIVAVRRSPAPQIHFDANSLLTANSNQTVEPLIVVGDSDEVSDRVAPGNDPQPASDAAESEHADIDSTMDTLSVPVFSSPKPSPVSSIRLSYLPAIHDVTVWAVTDVQFVFYIVPALLQGSFQYYSWVSSDHSDDICFHNYGCAKPLGNVMSFNHMISNVGYAINAFIYLVFVRIRRDRALLPHFGVYTNYLIELSLGCALFCEAFASAIYHYCPSQSAYHFDTPFIQVVCILIMLKLYGSRHCTISSRTAHKSISCILIGDVAISIFDHHPLLRIVLILGHVLGVLFVLSKVALGHDVSIESVRKSPVMVLRRTMFSLRHSVYGTITLIVNILLSSGYFFNLRFIQTNQIVTMICIVNMLLYLGYYYINKYRASEKGTKLSQGAALVSVVLWSAALFFFLSEETNWALTPAQSRALNSDCILMSFYDRHDVWHLLSAHAALATFIAVSTVDDPLSVFHRSDLVVF